MDDNPYQSPKFAPEPEKPPAKPPNRYFLAALYGFMAWGGLAVAQALIVEIVWVQTATALSLDEKRLVLAICVPIAFPVGMLIAWWTLRAPESKWVYAIALALALSPFVVGLIGIAFFAME